MALRLLGLVIGLLLLLFSCKKEQSDITVGKLKDGESLSDIISSPLDENDDIDTVNVAEMNFEKNTFYFGEVIEGEKVNTTFYFTNSGKKPLLIKDARSTCGCTVPTYPKEFIAPGSRDSIQVVFDTKNKMGYQNKAVTLIANTYPNKTIVYLKGKVKEKK